MGTITENKVYKELNKDYRYFYVKTLTHLKPTLTVQKEIFEVASSSQKDSAQQIADRTITNCLQYNDLYWRQLY